MPIPVQGCFATLRSTLRLHSSAFRSTSSLQLNRKRLLDPHVGSNALGHAANAVTACPSSEAISIFDAFAWQVIRLIIPALGRQKLLLLSFHAIGSFNAITSSLDALVHRCLTGRTHCQL